MAHILPDPPQTQGFRMASLPPLCPHGVPYAQRCTSCGWACPTCKRAYAPWVRECSYRHEEDWQARMGVLPGTFAPTGPVPAGQPPGLVMQIEVPPVMSAPGSQYIFRAAGEWREVFQGLQVLLGQPVGDGEALLHFRLAPEGTASDPADR